MQYVSDYSGRPLWMLPPDLDRSATAKSTDLVATQFESDAGAMMQRRTGALPRTTEEIGYLCETREKLKIVTDFLLTLKGRANKFLMPTWNDDLDVIGADFYGINIRNINFTENLFSAYQQYRTVMMYRRYPSTPQWFYRDLSANSYHTGPDTERIDGYLFFPYPNDWSQTSADVRYMFLRSMRLESDDITIEYLHGDAATITFHVVHLPNEFP